MLLRSTTHTRCKHTTNSRNKLKGKLGGSKSSNINTLNIDPSRTFALRKAFSVEITKRFMLLKGLVWKLIVVEDALGLRERKPYVFNTRWQFQTDPQKLNAFQSWLNAQLQATVLGQSQDAVWEKFIHAGFLKGAARAFDDITQKNDIRWGPHEGDFYKGTKKQFLESSFRQPETIEKVKLLASRTLTDLKGVTEVVATTMSRTLVDGLIQGKNPRQIGRDLSKNIQDIGIVRGTTIARTEIIRAHAEGQLMSMKNMGIQSVGVVVEWNTTGDAKVCQECKPLSGIVLTLDEASGLLPRHPQCRCCWAPANVGESPLHQKRTKSAIQQAIDESREAGGKKDTFGIGKELTVQRPQSILSNQQIHMRTHDDPFIRLSADDPLMQFSELVTHGGNFHHKGRIGKVGGSVKQDEGTGENVVTTTKKKPTTKVPTAKQKKVADDAAAKRAKFTGSSVGTAEHAHADFVSHTVAKMVDGITEEEAAGPGQKDKKPYDVRTVKNAKDKSFHDIEVKSLLKREGHSLSVHDDALLRKVKHIEENPKNTFHTVAMDERDHYEGGAHADKYSGHTLYYKRGSGRYALANMYKCKDADELKKLLKMSDDKLPELAKGQLPPPPPVDDLEKAANKASEGRKARDKRRKEANKDKLREQARARYELAKLQKQKDAGK